MRVVGKYCFALGDFSTVFEMTVNFYHHNALQGISSTIAHIERFSVYRKSLKGFISTRVIARNKVLLCLRGFLHAFHLVEMTTKKRSTVISSVVERSPKAKQYRTL